MGIRSASFWVQSQSNHSGFQLTKQFQDGFHVPFLLRYFGKNIPFVKTQAQMAYIPDLDSIMGPHQFFLKLPEHTLDPLHSSAVFFPIIAVVQVSHNFLDLFCQFRFGFEAINFHKDPYQTMTQAPGLTFFIVCGDAIQIMIYILVPFEFVSTFKKIRIFYHLDLAGTEKIFCSN